MTRLVPTVLAALTAGVALTGCGGAEPLPKRELIARADMLCAKAQREADALGEPRTGADVARIADVFEDLVVDVRALQPPGADRVRVAAMLGALEQGVTRIRFALERTIEPGRTLDDGRAQERRVAQDGFRLLRQAEADGRAYGFETCGRLG